MNKPPADEGQGAVPTPSEPSAADAAAGARGATGEAKPPAPSAGLATVEHSGPAAGRRPRLTWTDTAGRHELAVEERTVAGSAPNVGFVIADRTVSRLHAELDPRDDGLWIKDLGSRNGTFVDGVRIEIARAPHGRPLRLGGITIDVAYERVPAAPSPAWPADRFGPIVGGSPPMRQLYARLDRVARSDMSVLVLGETGTGKELVARALHEASARARGPFIVVDCAALPEALIESELFGHTKGAFTGAGETRVGAIEAADGGTVFLDEIGELPLAVQPKLLRVLERREVRPVGATQHRSLDVRFVSATHRDLRRLVNEGAFREDLYFRIAGVPLVVPPLRERPEDVPLLVRHLADRAIEAAKRSKRAASPAAVHDGAPGPLRGPLPQTPVHDGAPGPLRGPLPHTPVHDGAPGPLRGPLPHAPVPLTDAFVAQLAERPWLGNVRELRSFVERAIALGTDEALAIEATEQKDASAGRGGTSPASSEAPPVDGLYKDARERWLDHFERSYFAALLAAHDRNVQEAARAAGVDRTYVYKMIRRHSL